MLKSRKESGTYLATDSRHRWSAQMTMKKDNLLALSALHINKYYKGFPFILISITKILK